MIADSLFAHFVPINLKIKLKDSSFNNIFIDVLTDSLNQLMNQIFTCDAEKTFKFLKELYPKSLKCDLGLFSDDV